MILRREDKKLGLRIGRIVFLKSAPDHFTNVGHARRRPRAGRTQL